MPHSTTLPAWARVLVVVAHPDDESFGLGAVIGEFTRAGASVRVLCFSQGEASTLGAGDGDLREVRRAELTAAARILGVGQVELLDFPDGALAPLATELAGEVARVIEEFSPEGILIFHRDGVTGHPDHEAAGLAALASAREAGLPVLEWTLPAETARVLSDETGGTFTGYVPQEIGVIVRVDRNLHARAIATHASQAVAGSPLWRRLELLGEYQHLILSE